MESVELGRRLVARHVDALVILLNFLWMEEY